MSYSTDFYAWTQQQAHLLRENRLDAIDVTNLAEEIESLGISERKELISRLGVLIGHLLKWQYQPGRRSKSWVATIREQRRKVSKLLEKNPSLKAFLDEALAEAFQDALDLVVKETPLNYDDLPDNLPYSWEEAVVGQLPD